MSFAPTNPYLTLVELRDELKMSAADAPANSERADELNRDIERASRWVDEYTQRDYFFHNHATVAIELDQFDKGVYDDLIIPRFQPIIAITELKVGDVTFVEGTDFIIKPASADQHYIYRIAGSWNPVRPGRVISIKGRFGYDQSSYAGTVQGDTASQLATPTFYGVVPAEVFWKLEALSGGVIRLRIYSESAFTNLIAEGQSTDTTIYCDPMNGSGLAIKIGVNYTADDVDAANKLVRGTAVYDAGAVPTGLPGRVKISALKVAAVLSNRNTKEIADLAGQKTTILETDVPKIVYQMLGKRQPILI